MPGIVSSIAYVRLGAPDLDVQEKFLLDFGLEKVHRHAGRLYMRGIADSPFIHVTERGASGVVAVGYDVHPQVPIESLQERFGARVEDIDEPGGGKRLSLRDPNGMRVELVQGRASVGELARYRPLRGSLAESRNRGPARIERLVHTAYMTDNLKPTLDWYESSFGFLPTDELYIETPGNLLGRFIRQDMGEEPVYHHILFLFRGGRSGLHHASFEVERVDEIFTGGDHLHELKYDHVRGIGRHALGSQVFDYWMSPFGAMHEHWSSTEKMNVHSSSNEIKIGSGMAHDSGERPPERFVKQCSPILQT
ncbi:Glyoxalase/Bleomycin resistance protein/Dioxygenase superfamily protein [Pigmentiphaga humi]|uniref:Glyoxalase/Bleomycin resistance protein/Dioxygenase superfamily protein n=1 Tax=Pigmentiphaga humi TaxID=2478468 RepID=A0A3P4AYC5_9BURK|nr:VOC family protein [Pigmentiphaga humi]VCU69043.1 Glyoxalase/Bleomycin resistance protein/Dioxygenase superfamily protein [Pigmentiphaga humi]